MESNCELMGLQDAARFIGVSDKTLRKWWRAGQFPTPVCLGRKRLWIKTHLVQWLAKQSPIIEK
jgi:predicted DNA-binding transcriptional regulator AlpA